MALAVDPIRFANGICFHCQQCVEKYLKAILVSHDVTPERVHDLVALGTEAMEHAPEVEEIFDDLGFLTPFSVLIRYPDQDAEPEEAEEAIDAMERARATLRVLLGIDRRACEQAEEYQMDEEEGHSEPDNTTNGDACADQP
jgi:HEPN domain-containing protein